MKGFLHFYKWGMEVKLYMGLYTVAAVFFKGISAVLMGENSISVWTLLEMLIVSFVFSVIQYPLMPEGQWRSGKSVALWALSANVLYLGGALVFGWFEGIPLWAGLVLAAVLEGGLFAVWFGVAVARRRDTKTLNRHLQQFQNQQKS
ncbi:MAG: hypothetical protein ACI3VN_00455 [Candidatus Onthomonas sp.]